MNDHELEHDTTVSDIDALTSVEPDVAQALSSKRDSLIQKLREIDTYISEINAEYSTKLNAVQQQRKPIEEALFHIEALLKMKGHNVGRNAISKMEGSIGNVSSSTWSINDAAFALLQQTHSPTHYKEITAKLQERKILIPGKSPAATLLSRISRDSRFKRDKKRGVYALSTWRVRRKKSKSRKRNRRS